MYFKPRTASLIVLALLVIGLLLYARIATLPRPILAKSESNKISVVTSFYPLFFFASRVAGDRADILNVTPPGSEPHDYEPTPQDMARIEKSDLVVLNGAGLESWGDTLHETLNNSPATILTMDKLLAARAITGDNQIEGYDPHYWLNPFLAKKEVEGIAQALSAIDPSSRELYEKNSRALSDELTLLDAHYRQGLRTCKKKDIITSHAAFGYVGAEYGFRQLSIAGLSPDAEPTPKKLALIADFVKQHGIRIIFFETLVSPRIAETLARETGAQALVLNPLEGLTKQEDALGKNYLTEMEQNLTALRIALQCE